jgi:tight adherence protein B
MLEIRPPSTPEAPEEVLTLIPLLLSMMLATGVYLAYEGLTNPRFAAAEPEPFRLRRLEEFLIRAGLRDVTPRGFLLFSALAGIVSGLAAQWFLGWGVVSLLALGGGLLGPYAYFIRRHDRQRALVAAGLVESIEQLRDAIRTGLSVQEALSGLVRTGPEALRAEFSTLGRETRLVGFEGALRSMRDRLADPLFDIVAASLTINDRLGGRHVSQVLDRLAEATRAQLRIQQEVRAQQGRTVLSARIVAAAPLAALVGLRTTNPGYLSVFDSVWGQVVLVVCAACVGFGYAAMLYLTRLPGQRRVLVR